MLSSEIITLAVFFGVPAAMLIWFMVSLILMLKTPKENTEKRRRRKIMTIVSGVIAGILVLVIGGFIALLALAVANM